MAYFDRVTGAAAMVLSGNDYKNILETIDIIYSVPNTGAMFHALSDKLRKFIGVYSAIFVPVDARTGAMLVAA